MGWFYRRSAKFGPFRLNFSKSGIGVSAGIKGARVSTGPRGTYVNLGTNGVYYRQKVGGRSSAPYANRGVPQSGYNQGAHSVASLPGNLNYPAFPKHGFPRIVKTLGLLSLPILIPLWVLLVIAIGNSSTNSNAVLKNDNSRTPARRSENNPIQSSRDRGMQAGFDYWRSENAANRKSLGQRRVKTLAAQFAAEQFRDKEWQMGWEEGYKRAFESLGAQKANDSRIRDQTTSRALPPTTVRSVPPSSSNGYIRGPRGGCYYLSGSGRKVYVDRGLCN